MASFSEPSTKKHKIDEPSESLSSKPVAPAAATPSESTSTAPSPRDAGTPFDLSEVPPAIYFAVPMPQKERFKLMAGGYAGFDFQRRLWFLREGIDPAPFKKVWDEVPILIPSSIPGGAALAKPFQIHVQRLDLADDIADKETSLKKIRSVKAKVKEQGERLKHMEDLIAQLCTQLDPKGK